MNTSIPYYPSEYGYNNPNTRCSSACSSGSRLSFSSSQSSNYSNYSNFSNYSSSFSPASSITSNDSGYIPNYQTIPQNSYFQSAQPNPESQIFYINYPEKYMENFESEQPPSEDLNVYLSPSTEPFSNVDLTDLYNDLNLNSVFYSPTTKRGSGRPKIYTEEEKRERKLRSAKKSREKKKAETKQLFERVNEMKMAVETLKCTEYQFQDCFNDLLRFTSQQLYSNKF